jgi:hypothetical protein
MKQFRLAAWPQLRAPFDRIGHRRMLSDMSQRHLSVAQLVESSGLRRHEVREFLGVLESRGLIAKREVSRPESLFGSLRPMGGWLRRAFTSTQVEP